MQSRFVVVGRRRGRRIRQEMLDAAAPRGVDRHEIIAGTVFVGWFATLTLVNSFVKSDPRAVQQALLINPEVYKFPAVAFATAMFLGLIDSLSGLAGNKSKQLAIIPFVQNMVACTAFLSFAYPDSFLGSPVILDGFGRLLRKESSHAQILSHPRAPTSDVYLEARGFVTQAYCVVQGRP